MTALMTPEQARKIKSTPGEAANRYGVSYTLLGQPIYEVGTAFRNCLPGGVYANAEPWYADDDYAAAMDAAREKFEHELHELDVLPMEDPYWVDTRRERAASKHAFACLRWFDAWRIAWETKVGMQENHDALLHSKIISPVCPHCEGELTYIDTPQLDRFQCAVHGEVTEELRTAFETGTSGLPCPTCGASGTAACIGVRTGKPLRNMHRGRR